MKWIVICVVVGVVVLFLCRKKNQPKDVFYTAPSQSIPVKQNAPVPNDDDISKYEHLQFYSMYRWFYQKSKTTKLGKLIAKVIPKLCAQIQQFPKLFEYIFLLMCVPLKLNSGARFETHLETLDLHKRNIEIIEVNILLSIGLIVIFCFFALGALFDAGIFWCLIDLLIAYVILGNIVYCFKKIDIEMTKIPKE